MVGWQDVPKQCVPVRMFCDSWKWSINCLVFQGDYMTGAYRALSSKDNIWLELTQQCFPGKSLNCSKQGLVFHGDLTTEAHKAFFPGTIWLGHRWSSYILAHMPYFPAISYDWSSDSLVFKRDLLTWSDMALISRIISQIEQTRSCLPGISYQ